MTTSAIKHLCELPQLHTGTRPCVRSVLCPAAGLPGAGGGSQTAVRRALQSQCSSEPAAIIPFLLTGTLKAGEPFRAKKFILCFEHILRYLACG